MLVSISRLSNTDTLHPFAVVKNFSTNYNTRTEPALSYLRAPSRQLYRRLLQHLSRRRGIPRYQGTIPWTKTYLNEKPMEVEIFEIEVRPILLLLRDVFDSNSAHQKLIRPATKATGRDFLSCRPVLLSIDLTFLFVCNNPELDHLSTEEIFSTAQSDFLGISMVCTWFILMLALEIACAIREHCMTN